MRTKKVSFAKKRIYPLFFLVSFLSKPTTHTFPSPFSLKKKERTGKRKLPAAKAEKEEEGKEKGFSPPGAPIRYIRTRELCENVRFPPKKGNFREKIQYF